MNKVIVLELTEKQVLAIIQALPGSGYSGTLNLLRKLDRQLAVQTSANFQNAHRLLKQQNSTDFINDLAEVFEL